MKIRTLIIDDEPIALEKLKSYVEKTPFLELAASCSNGFEAMDILTTTSIDLIITDINMPDLNGLDFIKALPDRPMVIFTTAYDRYAVDSYRLAAVDYLLKPYGFADFSSAVNRAMELYIARNQQGKTIGKQPESLFIKTDHRYMRVNPGDIKYIKGYGEYLQVFTTSSSSPLVTLSSFATIMEKLPGNFLQIHRSYIVNMDHVMMIERNRVVMDAETYIPVGDSYKMPLQNYIASNSVGKAK